MKIIREIVEFKTFANHSVVWRSITKRDNAQKFPWNQLFSINVDLMIWRKKCWFSDGEFNYRDFSQKFRENKLYCKVDFTEYFQVTIICCFSTVHCCFTFWHLDQFPRKQLSHQHHSKLISRNTFQVYVRVSKITYFTHCIMIHKEVNGDLFILAMGSSCYTCERLKFLTQLCVGWTLLVFSKGRISRCQNYVSLRVDFG